MKETEGDTSGKDDPCSQIGDLMMFKCPYYRERFTGSVQPLSKSNGISYRNRLDDILKEAHGAQHAPAERWQEGGRASKRCL